MDRRYEKDNRNSNIGGRRIRYSERQCRGSRWNQFRITISGAGGRSSSTGLRAAANAGPDYRNGASLSNAGLRLGWWELGPECKPLGLDAGSLGTSRKVGPLPSLES
jgi:hypothetical protein